MALAALQFFVKGFPQNFQCLGHLVLHCFDGNAELVCNFLVRHFLKTAERKHQAAAFGQRFDSVVNFLLQVFSFQPPAGIGQVAGLVGYFFLVVPAYFPVTEVVERPVDARPAEVCFQGGIDGKAVPFFPNIKKGTN